MASSQYLAQALQAMAQAPQQQSAPSGPSLAQMQQIAQQRDAWQAANPGGTYAAHGLMQLGRDVMNAPQNLARAGQNIAGLPGQAATGFQKLIAGLPALGGGAQQYGGVPAGPSLA